MIFIFYGHSKGEVKKILETKGLLKLNDEVHTIDATTWTDESVNEAVATKSLFDSKECFFLDHVLSELEPEEIKSNLKLLQSTNNLIVFIENTQTKFTALVEKSAELVFTAQDKKEKVTFNIFSLTDALFEKDRKKLWLLYQKSILENLDPEFDIHRILFWAVKMLALTNNYSSANSAGISPFVYNKVKKGIGKFKEGEIVKMAEDLTQMTIKARQGEDWEFLLEKFILSL